jgi:hypothetical protein
MISAVNDGDEMIFIQSDRAKRWIDLPLISLEEAA